MKALTIGLLILLAAATSVDAHHGQAAFDQTSKITLTGTVTDFHFVNPHCVVEFEIKDATGPARTWQAEMTSPSNLKGWTATSLEPGDVVTITGYRAKSGAPSLWVLELSASNGMKLKGT
jgi:Family of unknown function (DUF6152)